MLHKRYADIKIIHKNGVISEHCMKIRWKKWFFSNAYMITKKGAFMSFFKIFLWNLSFWIWFKCFKCLKSNDIFSFVICFKKVAIVVKIAKMSKLFWICCPGNQLYATRRTCLQFNSERYFKYFQCYYLELVLNKRDAEF